jgi:thioredoxin-dependent peroxiredoxin
MKKAVRADIRTSRDSDRYHMEGSDMSERTGIITVGGNPVTLVGDEVKVGDQAPDCVALNNDLQPVQVSSFKGKVVILSFVTSLDTSVCDVETRRFNEEAGSLGDDVQIVTVSVDLPFAQKRWCGAAGIENVITLSDHKETCLGKHYGVLIKELRLLARSIFVIDKEGIVRYIALGGENANEPDYESALNAAKELL